MLGWTEISCVEECMMLMKMTVTTMTTTMKMMTKMMDMITFNCDGISEMFMYLFCRPLNYVSKNCKDQEGIEFLIIFNPDNLLKKWIETLYYLRNCASNGVKCSTIPDRVCSQA
jgi:hypothetical protein